LHHLTIAAPWAVSLHVMRSGQSAPGKAEGILINCIDAGLGGYHHN
jgi:hypothetical protein